MNLGFQNGAHIGYVGTKVQTGQGAEFKWVNDEFPSAYTNWFLGHGFLISAITRQISSVRNF